MASMYSLADGIGASQQAADAEQMNDAMSVIMRVWIVALLQQACQKILDQDQQNAYQASLENNPVLMNVCQEAYQADSARTDSEIESRQSDLQMQKSQTQTDGQIMSNTFSLLGPFDQLLELSAHQIARWGSATR